MEHGSAVQSGHVPYTANTPRTYTGKPLTQKLDKITVSAETELVEDQDFRLEYEDNVNAGTAKVFIHGMGKYADTAVRTFKINKAANPLK